jgi:anti-anti-sigma regulatory factor
MSHDPLADIEPVETAVAVVASEQDTIAAAGTVNGEGDDEIVLPASLTIAEVGELHRDLAERLQASDSLTIDCSGVDAVDGAGLQLLAALNKAAIERQVGIVWRSASASLRQGISQLGLQNLLDVN